MMPKQSLRNLNAQQGLAFRIDSAAQRSRQFTGIVCPLDALINKVLTTVEIFGCAKEHRDNFMSVVKTHPDSLPFKRARTTERN
jgi:hypothetical protein